MASEHQRRARRQEQRGAEDFGGRRNAGSGNGWLHKNDVRTARFSIEFKTTAKHSYTLRLEDLKTVQRNALMDGRDGLLVVDLAGCEFVVLDKATFLELLDDASGGA